MNKRLVMALILVCGMLSNGLVAAEGTVLKRKGQEPELVESAS